MLQDFYGNDVTTTSTKTVETIDTFADSYIGFGTDFSGIFAAADQDPECAVAAAYAALLGLFIENPARTEIALKYYLQAKEHISKGTEREQLFISAILAFHDNDVATSLKHLRRLATDYPSDIFAAKLGQNLYFNLGDDKNLLWIGEKIVERHPDCAYAYGMRAFGREQTSQLELAEEDGRKATEMKRKEPWAHHAVAHVLLTQGRHDEGIDWMQSLSDEWEDRNSFMYTHNWWHQALFYMEQGDFETPLALYDDKVWGVDKTYSLDQVNAISLLWRLEQLGVDVGHRWEDLSKWVSERTLINDQPFFDMHYAYSLARGGQSEALSELVAGVEKMAQDAPELTRHCWADVALPSVRGFIDIANKDFSSAARQLSAAQPRFQEIGGSHAQRDLFELAWLTSLVEAGDYDTVLPLLEKRLTFRQEVAADRQLYEDARRRAGIAPS